MYQVSFVSYCPVCQVAFVRFCMVMVSCLSSVNFYAVLSYRMRYYRVLSCVSGVSSVRSVVTGGATTMADYMSDRKLGNCLQQTVCYVSGEDDNRRKRSLGILERSVLFTLSKGSNHTTTHTASCHY